MIIERGMLVTCLNVAAEQFDEYAATMMLPRIAERFAAQAKEARALADQAAEATTIQIED